MAQDPNDPKKKPPPQILGVVNSSANLYEDSVVTIDPRSAEKLRSLAPEVSQGLWRERAYVPRAIMPKDAILSGMREALAEVLATFTEMWHLRAELKSRWLPFVQQALEQAGGDGLDVHLRRLLGKTGKPAKNAFWADLIAGYARLNATPTAQDFQAEAEGLIDRVDLALSSPPSDISLKVLEEELEGRLDLPEVISMLTASNEELGTRLASVRESLETIRSELRAGGTGGQPTSLLWNFTRVKAERILLESERRRRGLT